MSISDAFNIIKLTSKPRFIAEPLSWARHIPFARWIVEAHRPTLFVEIGTYTGNSFFSICDTLKDISNSSDYKPKAHCIGTWIDSSNQEITYDTVFDRINNICMEQFNGFVQVHRSSPTESLSKFEDSSIDLLHINGPSTLEASKQNLEAWFKKLSNRGIILLHDFNSVDESSDLWKFCCEIRNLHPSFELLSGLGLIIIAKSNQCLSNDLKKLLVETKTDHKLSLDFQTFFNTLGSIVYSICEYEVQKGASTNLLPLPAELILPSKEKQQSSFLKNLNNTLEYHLNGVIQENNHLRQVVDSISKVQQSKLWKLCKFLRRFTQMFIKGADEGRLGFIKWLIAKILKRGPTSRKSYDIIDEAFEKIQTSPNTLSADKPIENTQKYITESPEPAVVLHSGNILARECDIIIPVHSSLNWLFRCIDSLIKFTESKLIGSIIIVLDNCTSDEEDTIVNYAKQHSNITVIRNVAPHGFGAACNAGTQLSKSERIIFLNSDCIVAKNTISELVRVSKSNSNIGLACPTSNSAAACTIEPPKGSSFLEVDQWLHDYFKNQPVEKSYSKICTVVGFCLLVTRDCWNQTGGFDLSWGLGYGEETDLQMRARQKGFIGVLVGSCYAYHYGSGTFDKLESAQSIRTHNHDRFMKLWRNEFHDLLNESDNNRFVANISSDLISTKDADLKCDVCFILPELAQGVGGLHAIVDLNNYLILNGLKSRIIILGEDPNKQNKFREYSLSTPIYIQTQEQLLNLQSITSKIVVSTLFTTNLPAARFAASQGATLVNFVQGYEAIFEGGRHAASVINTYKTSSYILVTSNWLQSKLSQFRSSDSITLLPLGIDLNTFNTLDRKKSDTSNRLKVTLVIRSSPDKGQSTLVEIAIALADQVDLTIIAPNNFPNPLDDKNSNGSNLTFIKLPITRDQMALVFKNTDIYVDASLHEGFGLIPLEAMACGAVVICSDSGGVNEYLKNGSNGILVSDVNKAEKYIEAILALKNNRDELKKLQLGGIETAKSFSEQIAFNKYLSYFKQLLTSN
jgi:GT2 family glycosyltransferase/glycosyltransferase involved in cell wall biosynthesis